MVRFWLLRHILVARTSTSSPQLICWEMNEDGIWFVMQVSSPLPGPMGLEYVVYPLMEKLLFSLSRVSCNSIMSKCSLLTVARREAFFDLAPQQFH